MFIEMVKSHQKLSASFKIVSLVFSGPPKKEIKERKESKLQKCFLMTSETACDEREGVPITMRQMIVNWFCFGGWQEGGVVLLAPFNEAIGLLSYDY